MSKLDSDRRIVMGICPGQAPRLTRACSWYIWAAVNRRALTYLAQQNEVDEQRMGI